jgi:hypothetical protein
MGFNKRYVNKDNILNSLNNEYIASFQKADSIVMDNWCSNFFKHYKWNYNKYESIRKEIIDKYKLSSNLSDIESDINLYKLESLSNILINLENDSSWIDVLLTIKMLNIEIKEELKGQFDKLVQICKESIKNKFENE